MIGTNTTILLSSLTSAVSSFPISNKALANAILQHTAPRDLEDGAPSGDLHCRTPWAKPWAYVASFQRLQIQQKDLCLLASAEYYRLVWTNRGRATGNPPVARSILTRTVYVFTPSNSDDQAACRTPYLVAGLADSTHPGLEFG